MVTGAKLGHGFEVRLHKDESGVEVLVLLSDGKMLVNLPDGSVKKLRSVFSK